MSNYKKKLQKFKATLLLLLVFATHSPKAEGYTGREESISISTVDNPIFADDLNNLLSELPSGIKNYLNRNNLDIVLLEDANGAENTVKTLYGINIDAIKGFTDATNNGTTIYVESSMHPGHYEKHSDISCNYSEEEFNYMLAKDTLFHELGHCFDSFANFSLSSSDIFNSIYQEELKNFLCTTHYNVDNLGVFANVSSPAEYFATAYSCYINYPDELKELCPYTYKYINMYMEILNEHYIEQSEDKTIDSDSTKTKKLGVTR